MHCQSRVFISQNDFLPLEFFPNFEDFTMRFFPKFDQGPFTNTARKRPANCLKVLHVLYANIVTKQYIDEGKQ